MTNGDDLAYPTNQAVNDCDGNFMATISHSGLTKREHMATTILASLLSNPNICITDPVTGSPIAYLAIKQTLFFTDKLIEELNKKENEG